MFLKRLALENVRTLESCEISFAESAESLRMLTLVLGENGAGSSTILKSIALLMAGRGALTELLGEPDSWIRKSGKSCRIAAEIITPSNQIYPIELGIKAGDTARAVIERNKESLTLLDSLSEGSILAGYGAFRRVAGKQKPAPRRLRHARSVATLFSPAATLYPLEQWALETDGGGRKGKGLLRDALADLLPGVQFHGFDRKSGRLTFETADGIFPLEQLGDGFQSMAAWLGDLLYRIGEALPEGKKLSAADGLLLVDELDQHLHPVWQREIVPFLRRNLPRFQIIATTNSAMVAHQSRAGELWYLERDRPDAPPSIYRYEGDASRLMLHQLLASPLFGIDTVDSKPVEALRAEHRSLAGRPAASLSTTERSRRQELEAEIRDLPDWNTGLPGEEERRNLLLSIERALGAQTSQKAARSRKRK